MVELKVKDDENMLSQAINYYDFITENVDLMTRLYKEHNINPKKNPQLLLIAPSFSQNLINRCKWIDITIKIKKYTCLAFEDNPNEFTLYFEDISIPSRYQPMEVYTYDKHIKYITEEKFQNIAKKLLTEIQSWNETEIRFDPTKYGISMKILGRVFSVLYPKRKFFYVDYIEEDTWFRYEMKNESDFEELLGVIKRSYEDKL